MNTPKVNQFINETENDWNTFMLVYASLHQSYICIVSLFHNRFASTSVRLYLRVNRPAPQFFFNSSYYHQLRVKLNPFWQQKRTWSIIYTINHFFFLWPRKNKFVTSAHCLFWVPMGEKEDNPQWWITEKRCQLHVMTLLTILSLCV